MKSRVSLKYFVSYRSSLTNKKNIKTQLYMTLLKSEIPALPSNIEPHYPKFSPARAIPLMLVNILL